MFDFFRNWRARRAARRVANTKVEERVAELSLKQINAVLGTFTPPQALGTAPSGVDVVPPVMPAGVVPESVKLAQDRALSGVYEYANGFLNGHGFIGFPALIGLTQQPEYRKIVGVIAEEMTRKWVKIQAKGDDDKSEAIAELTEAMRHFKLREHFHELAIHDGFYGRGQLYIDLKDKLGNPISVDPALRKLPIIVDKRTVAVGSLNGFKAVEAMWSYPGAYNSDKPLRSDFYNPSTWYVMGDEIHASRLMTFVSQPVPDVLKPAYAFAGLSMIQIAMPYVGNWLRTRDSVSDLVNGFSVPILKTNMSGALGGGAGQQETLRVGLFQKWRSNFGVWMLNKGTDGAGDAEEFNFENVPLSGLDKLQAQAQEQQASVSSIPLVKLLGITPSGLNASSDGEVRVFYDHIKARQERFFRPGLERALQIIQLHLWGEIDEDLEVVFESLWEMDALQASTIRVNDAQTAGAYIADGVLMPEEVRQAVADDPDNPFHSIDTSIVPEVDATDDAPALREAA
jgi:phage-related protein (TIGR01555 family)